MSIHDICELHGDPPPDPHSHVGKVRPSVRISSATAELPLDTSLRMVTVVEAHLRNGCCELIALGSLDT
jgi:hypothetical protein